MWNHNNSSRKFLDNFKCKCDQRKANLDVIKLRVSKIIYKDICIKVHGLWGWGLLCTSMSLSILKCTISTNAFSRDLKTYESQNFQELCSNFPPTCTLLSHFKSVPGRWPLNYFVLKKFDSSNGFVKSSNPQNLKYFERRNLGKYTISSQHPFAFI